MSQPKTVFRFITVRNPRKPTAGELETGFARYDAAIAAPLIEKVIVAQAQGGAAVRAIIADFVRSDRYLRDTTALEARFGKLVEIGDWLMTVGGTLTAARLAEHLRAHPIDGGVEAEQRLWDNLVAFTSTGGVSEVREGVINALRALNLKRVGGALLEDDAAVKRVARATVVLPSGTSIPRAPAAAPAPGDGPAAAAATAKTKLKTAWAAIEAHGRAVDELTAFFEAETQAAHAKVAPQVAHAKVAPGKLVSPNDGVDTPGMRIGILDEKARAGLSHETRTLLQQLRVAPVVTAAHVIGRLRASAQKIGADASSGPQTWRRVVQVGGAFWMIAPAHDAPVAKDHGRELMERDDIEYDRFRLDREGILPEGHTLPELSPRRCQVKPLGVADYRRVEQELYCYEPGEVAHIENVLKGEVKKRVTRRLRRTEDTFTTATEEDSTRETDTQTTDRFELEKESEKAVEEELRFDAGLNVQGQFGPVRVTADARFSYAHSTSESDRAASKYAKEVTDRALERVTKRVREERVNKVLDEFEETNTHELAASDTHTVGIYRWVNKVYTAKVVNYNKRLMFEFMVPEPGAFHLFAMAQDPIAHAVSVELPVDPRSDETKVHYGVDSALKDASFVNDTNYMMWGGIYGAKLKPPPPFEVVVAKAYHRDGIPDNTQFSDSKNDLVVPQGYKANRCWIASGYRYPDDGFLYIIVGCRFINVRGSVLWEVPLFEEVGFVPVAVMGGRSMFYAFTVEVVCTRTNEHYWHWQIDTFAAILKAYEDRLAAYEVAFAEAKARAGVQIRGTNPLRNREIEMTELKKGALRLLTECADLSSYAVHDPDAEDKCSVPEFDCCTALAEGPFVQFFEQAFEWKLMTYLFYPYFWGRKCNLKNVYQFNDADPLFLSFLQSGYAKVHLPVRPGYEAAVLRFLADGVIWNGGSVPGVDSDMYLAIENEMKEPVGTIDPEFTPWPITVPTTLTVLQCESGCVEGRGLPRPGEDAEHGPGDPVTPP